MKSLWQTSFVICLVSAASVFAFADRNAEIIVINDTKPKADRQSVQPVSEIATPGSRIEG